MDTRYTEAVLKCTHDLCFEQKYEKSKKKKKLKIVIFFSREKSLYIVWACFRNGENETRTKGAAKNPGHF